MNVFLLSFHLNYSGWNSWLFGGAIIYYRATLFAVVVCLSVTVSLSIRLSVAACKLETTRIDFGMGASFHHPTLCYEEIRLSPKVRVLYRKVYVPNSGL